jgi:hypothetical protein
MIIGTTGKKLDEIVGEMKSYTSTRFKILIKENPQESRREWILWMMERAGKKNSNNATGIPIAIGIGNNIINQ